MSDELTAQPGESWVFDPAEQRAWGPFDDDADANAFIESDKYLSSWAVVYDGSSPILGVIPLFQPSDYHGVWPI